MISTGISGTDVDRAVRPFSVGVAGLLMTALDYQIDHLARLDRDDVDVEISALHTIRDRLLREMGTRGTISFTQVQSCLEPDQLEKLGETVGLRHEASKRDIRGLREERAIEYAREAMLEVWPRAAS